ncbi:MAG TPA: MFS transporter [Candidatus Onthovicinus excrementipullorum]|nr:MFS transporter [Candidatus Onthovicinus excrementipullorum]
MKKAKKINLAKIIGDVKSHWKTPPEGKYISYSEFVAYSGGGIGVNTINSLFGYVGLTANCLLLGSAYGISPMDLAIMSFVMSILNLVKTPFISMLVDNTNTKWGKFRPYLLWTGTPTAVLLVLMAFVPNSAAYPLKCTLLCLIYALLMIFQSLYALAFTSLAQVLTPNGQERTTLLSVSQFIYSLGPSLVNMLFPIFAGLFKGGMTGFTAYRVLFPIFSIFGIVLSLWTFKGTEEKIVVPRNYVARVRFVDGISEIKSNKYFWLMTLYNVLGGMKYGIGSILAWYCIYVMDSDAMLGVMNTIIGTASVPGMLLAPLLAKKLGKRMSLIWFNLLRAGFAALMLVTAKNPVLFLGCLYLATVSIGGDGVMVSSMTADVFDYQQWKTGKRLEGFITQFSGMLVTAATMLFNLILPWFYEHYGLQNDYTVLYNEAVRTPIFNVMIITTVISCIAAVIPILFYDMTEKKQKQMIEELKSRAAEEDQRAEAHAEIKEQQGGDQQ